MTECFLNFPESYSERVVRNRSIGFRSFAANKGVEALVSMHKSVGTHLYEYLSYDGKESVVRSEGSYFICFKFDTSLNKARNLFQEYKLTKQEA
jgi:hypothetical protein